jgi:2-polyprenyl-3-methyl-5-hydroxy-6-metoxy-1,4-benzoquinol methylase
LAFATPRPTQHELDAFYSDSYFAGSADGLGYTDYRGDSWAEANAQEMWRVYHYWTRTAAPETSVLDIGCATGGFLHKASQAGWRVRGVEKSQTAADVATREFGIPVASTITEVDERFGLITMWHVLEHLLDPVDALRQARDRLVPGGIVFIELPQWGSLGRRKNGATWSQLRPPEHINFFDRRALAAALSLADLRAIQVATVQPNLTNRGVEMIRQGRAVRGAAVALAADLCGRAGLGGYLRCAAVAAS